MASSLSRLRCKDVCELLTEFAEGETPAAVGTVGLSMGGPGSALSLSGSGGAGGKLLVAFMMFMGRVGPLTLAVALAGSAPVDGVRHPEGRVSIG